MTDSSPQTQSQSQTQSEVSQSELDEIISPQYITSSLGPGTLSTRLQTIASILPRIDQDDDDTIAQLDPLVRELGKQWILKQKKSQIRLLLACIYSDVLRVYAPEQPYSEDAILTKIFELMIESLDGVQNPKHDDYDFHFRVLESLSTVQSYIVMNDLESEALLMFLTKQLFKITKEKTVKLSLNHITDILCGVINDIQVIPEGFLQFILDRLIEPIRSQYPTEYDLATTVIRRCTDDLKIAIDEHIANTIASVTQLYQNDEDDDIKIDAQYTANMKKKNKKKAKELREKRKQYRSQLCIITELASISVDFIENSLLILEECLQNEHLEIRLLFVDMFASIFTQSAPSLSRQWANVFRVFLKRYDDVAVEIREFMANITCLLFQTQHSFAKDIQQFCIQRIEDVNERIRREITKEICMASIQSSSNSPTSIISVPLFNKLLTRTLDKKPSVRYIAIEYCAKLFGQHLCPYWRNNKPLPAEMRALLPIPKKMIAILSAVDFNTKLHLESIFDEEMIGNALFVKNTKKPFDKPLDSQQQIEQRMNVILGIIALLPDDSKKLFRKYFMKEKYQTQGLVKKILSTYNEIRMAQSHKKDASDDNDKQLQEEQDKKKSSRNVVALQRQYEISYSNFNQRFPIYKISKISSPKLSKTSLKQKPSDLLKHFIENPNGKMRHYLQNLCATSTKLKSIYNCSMNLASAVSSSADKNMKKAEIVKMNEFARSLCVRLSNVLFSSDAIPILLQKLVDIVEERNGQPRALLNSGIFILNCLCDEIPDIFDDHQCLQQLIKLFNFPNTSDVSLDVTRELSFVSLRILAKSITSHSFEHEDEENVLQDFLEDLSEKARGSASYEEAQLATECLVKCQGKYSSNIRRLCEETSKELDITEQYLPTLLSTLSTVAKLSPNIFITRASHIVEFILDTLLPYDVDENDGIYSENNMDDDGDEEVSDAEKRQKRKRGRDKTKTKKKNKVKGEEPQSMTPKLLSSKQCGIHILVNYLLSIADLPKDELGIKSAGISPVKSSPPSKRSPSRSPRLRKRKRRMDGIHSEDEIMNELDPQTNDEDDDEEATHLETNNEVQMMEEEDPFSNDTNYRLQQPISPEIECDRILDALFALIRKYGRINPDEIEYQSDRYSEQRTARKYSRQQGKKQDKKRNITKEEVSLVTIAVDGVLDIIRQPRYRRLLGLVRFYELGFLIHHKNESIRTQTLQSFWNRLRDHKLPSHYSCIFPLVATDPNKKLREMYRPAVQRYFDRMRKENRIRSSSSTNLTPYQISKLPEYLLFYVVHLLAHHPDFDEKLARKEIKDFDSSSYQRKKSKAAAFVGWRGRRTTAKSSDSEYDTSPSRMIKKKKKENQGKQEDDKGNEESVNDKEEAEEDQDIDVVEEEKEKKERKPQETSCVDYFGTIFDFYFNALLRGSQSNQFPLIIKILAKMEESYDVFKPLSKGHRYLIRIAMFRLKKLYKNKSFQDFPGRIPLPKALFKSRETHHSSSSYLGAHDSSKIDTSSPRRVAAEASKSKNSRQKARNLASHRLLRTDQSLLATTASDTASIGRSAKKKGLFTSELLKKKYGDLDAEKTEKKVEENEEGSDHPSDDDIMGDMRNMNVSGLDMSVIRRNLNETIIDKEEDANDKKEENVKIISSGSGADADDEQVSAVESASKQKRNAGKKRRRNNAARDKGDEPPKKKSRKQATKK